VVIVPMVGARYERASWPAAGGAGDQDAWLTQALEHVQIVHNALLREAAKRTTPRTTKEPKRRG
jgi:hypothetical protein